MKTSVTDLLTDARQFFIQRGFAKGTLARDKDGHETEIHDIRAQSFCALGALYYVSEICDYDNGACHTAQMYLLNAIPTNNSVPGYNDLPDTTKNDIITLYDRAITISTEFNI
jgi:hypothetical protein